MLKIHDLTEADKVINLAEVQLYYNGRQLCTSQASCEAAGLTFALSPGHYETFSVSQCFDGDTASGNYCHSDGADPSLTISGISALDRVVVYNRRDGCGGGIRGCSHRIEGATITYTVGSNVMWESTFEGTGTGNLKIYDFTVTTGEHESTLNM